MGATQDVRRAADRRQRRRLAAAAEQATRRSRRRRRVAVGAGITAAVLAVIAGVVATVLPATNSAPGGSPIPGVVVYHHLTDTVSTSAVSYPQVPPAGGPHSAEVQNCGIYTQPVPNTNAVFDLAVGAVWITYQPGISADQLVVLKDLVESEPLINGARYMTLSPYPGLPSPVVATAWGVQLRLPSANDPRLPEFIHYYRLGPQTPEPSAPCTGGVGTPSAI
ncbi:MAG: DUF3105 domain-containing protein [Mycobacteriales bacterium]